jgi:type IV pilus assembly protein PilC
MPYFKWYALDERDVLHSGTNFARSPEYLLKLVHKKQFPTLVSCTPLRKKIFSSLSLADRALFFKQIGFLLKAGIRVVDALAIAEQTVSNKAFKEVIADCGFAVQEGISLSEACSFHIDFFTPFACKLLLAGEESGTLATACEELAAYYETVDTFSKRIKAVLMMPAVTLLFFCVILVTIFWAVIPRFGVLLRSLHKPLPARTELLLTMSDWLTSGKVIPVLGFVLVAGLGLRWLVQRLRKRFGATSWALYVPFMRLWLQDSAAITYFKTLGSLLQGGVDITKSLSVACLSIAYTPLRVRYEAVSREVEAGVPLSTALKNAHLEPAPQTMALILLGEATGNLGQMLIACSAQYQEKLYKMLDTMSKLVQPLLLLILGLLVGCLVFVLYEPIFTLSMVTV